MSTRDALIEGGRTRVRPILMTAIATILALIPLAAGFNEGSIIAAELGTVVIGGLFSSTFLTLLVVPVVYLLVDGLKVRVARRFAPSADTDERGGRAGVTRPGRLGSSHDRIADHGPEAHGFVDRQAHLGRLQHRGVAAPRSPGSIAAHVRAVPTPRRRAAGRVPTA